MATNHRTLAPRLDLPTLQKEVERLKNARMSPETEKGYAYNWLQFQAFCVRARRKPMPASSATLSLFIADQLSHKKVATVCRLAAGVAFQHRRQGFPSPFDDAVHDILRGAKRLRAEQPRKMPPLTVEQLRKVSAHLEGKGSLGARNRAIVVVGFASALRRANLAALSLEDITFCAEGMTVMVRREKQDKQSAGRLLGAPFGLNVLTCPVRSLEAWLRIRGDQAGPLFTRLDSGRSSDVEPLSKNAIGRIVTAAIAGSGLDGRYGPHSLRAGMITEAGLAGVSALVIAEQSGHQSLNSLKGYFRPANLFRANASGMIGL
jgi:integrase